MSGAPLAEALPGRADESLADLSQRAIDFARHYYGLDVELEPDLAWALSITAFNIESSDDPARSQKQVLRITRWLEAEGSWPLPDDLMEDLQQAAERAASVEAFIEGLEQSTSGLGLEEEKARLVGRLCEEVLRPMLAILTYLAEGNYDPSRYGELRRDTLATISSGLEPRLPQDLRSLGDVPIDYRHAYAHGGIGNNGLNVILDLIEPPRRLVIRSQDIDGELEGLLRRFLVLVPALLLSLTGRFKVGGKEIPLPLRMVGIQAELLFALSGLDVSAKAEGNVITIRCTALPANPVRLLNIAAGLRTVTRPGGTLVVISGSDPTFEIPLDSLPAMTPGSIECLVLRYRLLAEWSTPPLSDPQKTASREGELAAPIVSVLFALVGELANVSSHEEAQSRLKGLGVEARRAAEALDPYRRESDLLRKAYEVTDQLKRDCRRVLSELEREAWSDVRGQGFLTRPEYLVELNRMMEQEGIQPRYFAGSLA